MTIHMTDALVAEEVVSDVRIKEPIPASSWIGLAAMMFASIYAIVDRQIFLLFAQAIKLDLGLSDTQLGILQGLGLTFVGLITVYPISWLADRRDRRKITAGCIAMWSVAVVGCGLSPGFALLLIFSSLVGIGEAGVGPAGYAMIPDLFPKSARQIANSAFAIASRLAMSIGVYFAGLLIVFVGWLRPSLPPGLAAMEDWRLVFLSTALFAPMAVASIWFLPARASGMRVLTQTVTPATGSMETVWQFLKRHRKAWTMTMSAALSQGFGAVAVAGWAPIVAQRYFGQTPQEGGAWMASIGLASAIAGFAIGVPVMQRLQQRVGLRAPIYIMVGCLIVQAFFALAMGAARNVPQLYVLWGFQATAGMITTMAVPTILQNMAPIHLRARIFAIAMFVGMAGAVSYVAVGGLSDLLTDVVAYPLLYAAAGLGFVGLMLGAFLFWQSQHLYEQVAMESNA